MTRAARLAATILPLVGLAALWVQSERTYETGTDWEVPIQGYDPRDYLRGHYVEFAYDWPGLPDDGVVPVALCLEGTAPVISRVIAHSTMPDCAHPVMPRASDVYGVGGLVRGRLYLGQDRATALQEQLRDTDQRGIVRLRQRDDGSFTPVGIRFRPLTPAERAERDAPSERAGESPPPPAIMVR
jgi:hypothetical protein